MKFLSPTIPDIESFVSLMDPSSQWHVAWAYLHAKIVKKTMHTLLSKQLLVHEPILPNHHIIVLAGMKKLFVRLISSPKLSF